MICADLAASRSPVWQHGNAYFMFTEGVPDELPQSIMEQALQNQALGRPLEEGVDHAVVLGWLSGSARARQRT